MCLPYLRGNPSVEMCGGWEIGLKVSSVQRGILCTAPPFHAVKNQTSYWFLAHGSVTLSSVPTKLHTLIKQNPGLNNRQPVLFLQYSGLYYFLSSCSHRSAKLMSTKLPIFCNLFAARLSASHGFLAHLTLVNAFSLYRVPGNEARSCPSCTAAGGERSPSRCFGSSLNPYD